MATDGYVSAPLDMLLQHELIVHFCKKSQANCFKPAASSQQLNEAGAVALDDVDILIDGYSR